MESEENVLISIEEEEDMKVQEHSDSSDCEENVVSHRCPVCKKPFRISKLLFEHMVADHRNKNRWKISQILNTLEAKETIYSSDSDCEYEIQVEVIKKVATRDEFESNLRTLNYANEPLKVLDERSLLKTNRDEITKVLDPRIQCPKCVKTFSGRKNLRQHIKIYHVEETGHMDFDLTNCENFICPECKRELSNARTLRKHIKLCHNLIVRFIGEAIGGKVVARSRTIDFYETPQVVKNETANEFPILRLKDDDTGRTIFKCGMCEYGPFFFARAIKRHQVKEHGREPLKMDLKDQVFRCDYCSKEFWTKDNLKRHTKLHSDVKNYICILCGMSFKTSAVLRKHRLAHINIKCLLCDAQFTLRSDYKSHHKTKHNHESKSFEILEAEFDPPSKRMSHIPSKVEKPVKCHKCDRVFSAMCGYKVHKCVDVEEEPPIVTKKQKKVQTCQVKNLKKHKCLSTEKVTCCVENCGLIFTNTKQYTIHMENDHQVEEIEIIYEEQMV